jgi:dihydrofolate synthase / folylpolyglutamate synthase
MILAVTSKIVSLAEGRLVPRARKRARPELVRGKQIVSWAKRGYGVFLTVKEGLFIPSAGIDESNSEGGGVHPLSGESLRERP